MFHRSGLVRPDVPSVRSGPLRSAPVWARGGERADAFSRSWLIPERVNRYRRWLDDQRLIAASMVSRRRPQAI
jgi:hypothetical protein